MKYISHIAAAFALSCAINQPAFAHNDFHLSCETNVSGNLSFANNELTVVSESGKTMLFKPTGVVSVDGNSLNLNSREQKLAQTYYSDIEASIPMVVDITVEALNITKVALTEVFKGFLGEQSELPNLIDNKLTDATKAIEDHVYQNPDSLTFNSTYLSEDLGFDESLDQEIDEIKDELISSMMGQILISMGQSLFSGDTDFSDFEQRMEKMGEEIEQKADIMSKALEEKAELLCEKMQRLNTTENELSKIDGLSELNLIDLQNKA